ncbi:MAG: homocysteine S-methyltransferase family protein, partial [Pirellulaceae bacterium]
MTIPTAINLDGLILDGGLATELEHHGHQLTDQLWSARLLRDDPNAIRTVHRTYLDAGADIIATASYQATIQGFVESGLDEQVAIELIRESVRLAKSVRDEWWSDPSNCSDRQRPLVAASVG